MAGVVPVAGSEVGDATGALACGLTVSGADTAVTVAGVDSDERAQASASSEPKSAVTSRSLRTMDYRQWTFALHLSSPRTAFLKRPAAARVPATRAGFVPSAYRGLMAASLTFRAMNTDIDVLVEGVDVVPGFVAAAFEEEEARFSRFRPESLLSRLNAGEAVADERFAEVCALALRAHALTDGLYNPMVLPALREAGYDESFEQVRGGAPRGQAVPSPTAALEIGAGRVRLREGALDLGGLVKGLTVDLVADELEAAGLAALVNAGGDVRAVGAEAGREGWGVAIAPANDALVWEGDVRGGLATSTMLRRRWRTDDGSTAHHLIDPRSGLPARSGIVQASVWAASCWLAEVWAKAIVIGGASVAQRAAASGSASLTVDEAGEVSRCG